MPSFRALRHLLFSPSLVAAAVFATAFAPASRADAESTRVHVVILSTTDLHGHIDPIDYYTDRPAETGLAKLATLINQTRADHPNLILLDSGDTIQGTPLAYYHNRKNNAPPDPMMLVMNSLHYDAMTIGNHEYNFGLPVLQKARSEATFPWLSANTYRAGTDTPAYQPYLIKEIDGVRIGILGLTTPGIPYWENPENYAGLEFHDAVPEAAKWVRILREKEHVDAVVVAMHLGIDQNLETGRAWPGNVPHENAAIELARKVPDIDLVLMGHTHVEVPDLVVNGVLLTQADHWGNRLVRADLYFDRQPDGHATLLAKSARILPINSSVPADPAVVALAAPYDAETQAWLGRVIGHSDATITGEGGYLHDTALLDLIQHVQLEAGQADVSMAANFNLKARIPAGDITVRDIAGLYVYENTLLTVEVTGAQLKAALEHSARFFRPYVAGKSPTELIDHQVPGYNFDIAQGVDYEIDLTRPYGDRIRNLTFHGAPLTPDQKLRVAVNNYRVNGGGGYTMYKDAPVVYRSSAEIRDLIIDWVEKHHTVPTTPDNNWHLLPQ